MAKADAFAIAGGIPGRALMEAAGRAVAAAVMRRWPRRPVVVLCGPGNNGGDGFVTARILHEAGWPVRLALAGALADLKGDAAWAAGTWERAVAPLSVALLDGDPLVVDALFGAGLSRPISGIAGSVIDRLNERLLTVVSVDVPSGLHGDSGQVLGRAPKAACTVSFFRAKPGHYSEEGLKRCGDLHVVDIGIPPAAIAAVAPRQWLNAPALWRELLLRNDLADHKYARGHLTVLAGPLATGAARLAALAGRRAGAGLVTIATPRSALPVYQAAEPGNLVVEADDAATFARLLEDPRRNAVLIGPGSGVGDRTKGGVLAALAAQRGVVLDADAITSFAGEPQHLFQSIRGEVLLTPHEGEFRRMFPGVGGEGGKVARARQAASLSGATVLLKGPDTVIAAPDGRVVINVHASAALATAGSGDVLAGVAGGLMAQGLTAFAAAAAAAWLHGDCARRFARPGLIAEDLPNLIPDALQLAFSVN
ncbi:NAD(P)H-hydrate dehydratase [Reyranella sp.]|uniref:NAD(P)H-hydrate dehydratase n=1 Tax=Reyranella sp. TaxID=1929291 RepID=UPI0011FBB127|nr:NAD(P)H-hydrate dehydratase [Reyranella sp.]TAJ89572.1 MAG: NAD(P)H-hydrate dehydratase [Reyranella sp.]